MESQTSLLDLNDFCLLKVFGDLNLTEMIKIRKTCKRLNAVSQLCAGKFKEFSIMDFADEVIRCDKHPLTATHIDEAMQYTAPIVESLSTFEYKSFDFSKLFQKYDFPSLKSLTINKSGQLRWIKNENVENLDIQHLKRGDLNNYARNMTKVKQLTLYRISDKVPISELVNFFVNNPNIESLRIVYEYQRKLSPDFFEKLKNLKMLEFPMGDNHEDLLQTLELESLNELELKNEYSYRDNHLLHNTTLRFLTRMAQKQTLRSINMRGINFVGLIDVIAPLNLESLRIVRGNKDVLPKLATLPFPNLKDLDLGSPVSVSALIALIKNLTALEKLHFAMIRPFDKPTLLIHLNQLLRETQQHNRPDLNIDFLIMPFNIKISFNLGTYEIERKSRRIASTPSA